MTQHPELFARLCAPFENHEVKSRSQSGRQLHYITARTAMNRLDDVLGPENWWHRFVPGEKSVLCELTIRLGDGQTLTKSDAGGYAGMADSGDDEKSGYSDAFKRACVMFGVGRYLYGDGVPAYAGRIDPPAASPRSSYPPAEHQKERDRWGNPPAQAPAQGGGAPANGGHGGHGGPPRSGKALFAWTKEQEQRYSVGLLKYLNSWAKLQEFPGRMVDWDQEQVARAHAEAVRKLQSITASDGEVYEEALGN